MANPDVIVIVIVIVIIAPYGVEPLTGALPRGRLWDGKHTHRDTPAAKRHQRRTAASSTHTLPVPHYHTTHAGGQPTPNEDQNYQ